MSRRSSARRTRCRSSSSGSGTSRRRPRRSSVSNGTVRWGMRIAVVAAAVALAAPAAAAPARQFKSKQCVDCHTKQAKRFASLKVVHSAVRKNACEDCHLRHGMIQKLVLKEPGNGLRSEEHTSELQSRENL